MWCQKIPNGRYQYFERYVNPYTEKTVRISVTLDKNTRSAQKQASILLNEKIQKQMSELTTNNALFKDVLVEWWELYKKSIKQSSISSMSSSVNYLIDNLKHTC